MQGKNSFKWGYDEITRLEKELKRFNAKISRVNKKHPELNNVQPKKIKKKEFMNRITSSEELDRELDYLSQYSKRNMEYPIQSQTGNKVTRWERSIIQQKVDLINERREEERKKYNIDRPDKQIGTMKQNEFKPKSFNFDKKKGGKEWEKFKESIEKELRRDNEESLQRYKQNYLDSIILNLQETGNDLWIFLKEVPADVIYRMYWEDDELLKIDFVYDPLEAKVKADAILSHWKKKLNIGEELTYNDVYG